MIELLDVYDAGGIRAGALEWLYELMREREGENTSNISFKLPTFEQHRQFVTRRPYRYWYLLEATPPMGLVGYVSATHRNEIGIVLKKAARHRGYGTEAVRTFIENHEPLPSIASERAGRWLANINPANTASIALFRSLGGRHIQNTYEL